MGCAGLCVTRWYGRVAAAAASTIVCSVLACCVLPHADICLRAAGWQRPAAGSLLSPLSVAGSPAPLLARRGAPAPFSSSPLPLVAPSHGGSGFGRAVTARSAGFFVGCRLVALGALVACTLPSPRATVLRAPFSVSSGVRRFASRNPNGRFAPVGDSLRYGFVAIPMLPLVALGIAPAPRARHPPSLRPSDLAPSRASFASVAIASRIPNGRYAPVGDALRFRSVRTRFPPQGSRMNCVFSLFLIFLEPFLSSATVFQKNK